MSIHTYHHLGIMLMNLVMFVASSSLTRALAIVQLIVSSQDEYTIGLWFT